MNDSLENEIWKQHTIGVNVSNLGRVFIKQKGKPHYTYGSNNHGYKVVSKDCKNYYVHRLVAECFIDNPNNYTTVDHINRNKSDNRVENLRWATRNLQSENQNHPLNNANSKQVAQINPKTNEIIRIWESINECGRNDYSSSAVSACCRNVPHHLTYKGYKWQFVA